MGRAERRKDGKKEKVKTYVMTEAQIEEIRRQARDEAIDVGVRQHINRIKAEATDRAMAFLLAIPIVILRDKFGFGKGRIAQFLSYATTWIKAVNSDENTLNELIQIAYDEAGYEVEGFNYKNKEKNNHGKT